ncbi:hypothetical protein DOTSEDRAFT_39099 [Dothistroma septosporum NZE10]|uniref:Uncharacterized protein n=1 Tax=Dothistroma septosporum (strain NZE10 / CBS 128990) TaxID=675120 RepID=M2Y0R4_DOTSN|nr:hypothetical protein DOTSEDRAFT_39099 [Dothistroma septosporum NZE10]
MTIKVGDKPRSVVTGPRAYCPQKLEDTMGDGIRCNERFLQAPRLSLQSTPVPWVQQGLPYLKFLRSTSHGWTTNAVGLSPAVIGSTCIYNFDSNIESHLSVYTTDKAKQDLRDQVALAARPNGHWRAALQLGGTCGIDLDLQQHDQR